jgi:hypothetical protein
MKFEAPCCTQLGPPKVVSLQSLRARHPLQLTLHPVSVDVHARTSLATKHRHRRPYVLLELQTAADARGMTVGNGPGTSVVPVFQATTPFCRVQPHAQLLCLLATLLKLHEGMSPSLVLKV